MPCPNNSHPESKAPRRDKGASRAAIREIEDGCAGGLRKPRTRKPSGVVAENFEKIQRFLALVGQKFFPCAAALCQLFRICSVKARAVSVKPASWAAARKRGASFAREPASSKFCS